MIKVWQLCFLLIYGGFTGCGYPVPELDDAATALVEAKQAIADGEDTKAMALLDSSIAARPDPWAYLERAKLHADAGNDESANSDVQAGLELDPEHADLLWLKKELKKSKTSRFKGRSKEPPSASK